MVKFYPIRWLPTGDERALTRKASSSAAKTPFGSPVRFTLSVHRFETHIEADGSPLASGLATCRVRPKASSVKRT